MINRDGSVLDVGRTQRLATKEQRKAILVAQQGTCLNPGCGRTHLEIHHYQSWANGGATDLDNLGGYCIRCHHLIHQGMLVVTLDPRRRPRTPDQIQPSPPPTPTTSRATSPDLRERPGAQRG